MSGKATRARVYRQLKADPADRRHGTYYAYCCGCRCARCMEAMRAYHRVAPGKATRATREREPWGCGSCA